MAEFQSSSHSSARLTFSELIRVMRDAIDEREYDDDVEFYRNIISWSESMYDKVSEFIYDIASTLKSVVLKILLQDHCKCFFLMVDMRW